MIKFSYDWSHVTVTKFSYDWSHITIIKFSYDWSQVTITKFSLPLKRLDSKKRQGLFLTELFVRKIYLKLGSRTLRIMNNSVYERMAYCVSSYEHASRQHRGAISWEYQRRQYS
jgi:hypothetical protein